MWSGISDNVSGLSSIWWEDEAVTDGLNAFRRSLFVPLVKKLGYEYSESDSADITQLRTTAISHAASAEDPE